MADQVLADLPPIKWQFYRFLLYSESPYLPDPLSNGDFTDSCEIHNFIHTLRAQHLTDQVLAQLTPSSKAISQIPTLLWELIFGRPSVGRSTPIKWQFHRFLFWQLTFDDSSYFIPTLRAWHLADQVLADLPPFFEWQFHWFQLWQLLFHSYSESLSFGRQGPGISTSPSNNDFIDSCSDSSLLWELIIWQTRSWQIYPPPHQMAISQISALTAPYSKSSTFDRPGLGRSETPHQMAISQIPVKFIYHSYSESSTFDRPGLGRSTAPHQMAISQIPTLLWKLIFVSPNVFWSTPHPPMVISQMLADRPPHQTAISQIPALLW